VTVEPLSDALVMQYIGGRGIAAKLLYDELGAGADPLSPVNKLLFFHRAAGKHRAQACSAGWSPKSPLTAAYSRKQRGRLALK